MDEPLNEGAKGALGRFAAATTVERTTAQQERGWERALDRSRVPRRARWLAFGAILATAAALIVVLVVPRKTVAPAPIVLAAQGAKWQQHDDVVELTLGQLRLQTPREHVRVKTPQLEIEANNARALVDVTQGQTLLAVEEGEVVYRTARGEWHLKAGERIVISDVADAVAVAAPVPVASCADADTECLKRVAGGSGLAAEMALYRLGLLSRQRGALDEAVGILTDYGQRFPDGTFGPEASIALMLSLHAAGETQQAAAEAVRFVQRFPKDPRVEKVLAWRAHALEQRR